MWPVMWLWERGSKFPLGISKMVSISVFKKAKNVGRGILKGRLVYTFEMSGFWYSHLKWTLKSPDQSCDQSCDLVTWFVVMWVEGDIWLAIV
jgi:hypothetical protein